MSYCHLKTHLDRLVAEEIGMRADPANDQNSNYKILPFYFWYWDDTVVAAKIQFYNIAHPDNKIDLNPNTIEKVAETLINYELEQKKSRYEHTHPTGKKGSRKSIYQGIVRAIKDFKTIMPYQDRKDAVEYLSYLFSEKLSMYSEIAGMSREKIANGYKYDGKARYGEFALFEEIFQDLQIEANNLMYKEYQNGYINEEEMLRLDGLLDIMDNWDALVLLAKTKLSITEKLNLGHFLSFAKSIHAINDMELMLEDNEEEMPKDPADRIKDEQISSFKRMSQVTRRVLSMIPVYEKEQDENGEWHYVKDEEGEYVIKRNKFGVPTFMNPTAVHNILSDLLITINSKHDVLRILKDAVQTMPELQVLLDVLSVDKSYYENKESISSEELLDQYKNSDRILQSFYLDFNKVNQSFAKIKYKIQKVGEYSVRTWRTVILNEKPNKIKSIYEKNLASNNASSFTLFDSNGNLREDQMNKVIKAFEMFRNAENGDFEIKQGERNLAIRNILTITKALGIPYVNQSLVSSIISNGYNLSRLLNNLKYVYDNVIQYYIKYKNVPADVSGTLREANGLINYKKLYTYQSKEDKSNGFSPHMVRLANTLCTLVNQYDMEHASPAENKVRTKNAKGDTVTLFSNINPGYMSQFVKDIQGYAKKHDLQGLRKYLDLKFGKNPALCDMEVAKKEAEEHPLKTSKFRLKWLNDLYNSNSTNVWSFVNQIALIRNLGNDAENIPFENMSKKDHFLMMLSDFVQMRRNSNNAAKLAYYPVFISGDANQHKTLTAPIYYNADILAGMVDLFYLERNLQAQLKAMQEDMARKGFVPFEANTEEFSLMPCFNEIFAGKNLDRLSEKEIKDLINNYFSKTGDAFNKFKDTCAKYGVITQKDDGGIVLSNIIRDQLYNTNHENFLYNFWLNQKFAMAQQMSLMTISPAFYKDLKTLQKRYKETHSSGQKLDIDATWNGEAIFKDKMQSTIIIQEVTANCEEFDPAFMEVIANEYGKDSEIYKMYKKIDTTDGQAYRTLESYRKIAIGTNQWSDEAEELYNEILSIRERHTKSDGTIAYDEITDEEIRKIQKYSVIFQPIKPFLFTHERYGFNDDGSNEGHIPVQIKCSECVLIPELLPKGSRLKHIAEYMTDNQIDVCAMTSAIKVGSWGQVDISSAKDQTALNEAMSKAKVHKLNYADYMIQVNVPPHEYQARLFATQIRKLIIGGEFTNDLDYFNGEIPLLYRGNGSTYRPSKMNKQEIIHFYNELLVSNFIETLSNFKADISTKEKISDLLIKNLLSNDRSTIDSTLGLLLNDQGDFTIPLCEALQEHDVVNELIALFKKMVNKQSIYGGSGVQAASYGLKGYEESDNLHFITSEDKKNILYAEVVIPLMHTYTDSNGKQYEIDYDTYCNADGTLKTDDDGNILIDKDFPGIRDFVSYRIPTERAYSMINCKAVRFTRPTAGITIQVPSQGVKIAGFDFDIDKLYFMFKSMHLDSNNKPIEYDFSKDVKANEKFARDNMILEIIRQRLMDPATLRERTTPGGFENARDAMRDISQLLYNQDAFKNMQDITRDDIKRIRRENNDKDFEPNYDYTDIETMLILNERNQLAAKLIGIFANQNANHSYCSGLKEFRLNEKIAFGKYYESGLSDLLHSPEGVDTYQTLAELLAASVDAVKDPVLGYLNINTQTAGCACLLARLGYDLFDIGLLLNQPIIKHVCDYALDNNVSIDYAINNFIASIEGKDISYIEASNPSQSELIENIVKNAHIESDEQIAVLKLFENILTSANELNTVVNKTKFTAANSLKPTYGNYYAQKADLTKLTDLKRITIRTVGTQSSPIVDLYDLNDADKLDSYFGLMSDNPMAFEQAMYDCMKAALQKMLEYFPYDTDLYKYTRDIFSHYSKYGNLDEKTINMIHRDIPVFLLSSMAGSLFNTRTMYDENMTIGEYMSEHFVDDFKQLLKDFPEINDTPFISALSIETDQNTGKEYIKMNYSTSIDEKQDREAIIESWEELVYGNVDDRVSGMMKGLFLYNFFKSGFAYGPSSFLHFAPTQLKEELIVFSNDEFGDVTYADFWNGLLLNNSNWVQLSDEQILEFLKQFIANHLDNTKFVTHMMGETAEELEGDFQNSDGTFKDASETIEVDENTFSSLDLLSNIAKPVYEEKVLLGYIFRPCISFYDKTTQKKVYYMLDNMSGDPESSGIYRRVYPIGETNRTVQYAENLYHINPIEETFDDYIDGDSTNQREGDTEDPTEGGFNRPKLSKNELFNTLINKLSLLLTKVQTRNIGEHIEDSELEQFFESRKEFVSMAVNKHKDDVREAVRFIVSAVDDQLSEKDTLLVQEILNIQDQLIVLNQEGEPEISC